MIPTAMWNEHREFDVPQGCAYEQNEQNQTRTPPALRGTCCLDLLSKPLSEIWITVTRCNQHPVPNWTRVPIPLMVDSLPEIFGVDKFNCE